ncbi:type II toxin-antitoxin system RelB/DinJ family antitoxin [Parasutterella secunda]|uniref:type II toxin-antitoxin system RelB/DinJ family antitoxin n=1 Tax=Parasutterella secunda TaxID=626947 RepID=UPI0025A32B64|nr:type II toxin-antitoxin system RelB/DinJ family antitoxin [Parasutterella secunda]MDM8217433.1 type II toxin-antitoxin system RelB/DinJ family antitoxin [Parasutterella secunda]
MATTNLQIRLDNNLRNEAQGILNDMGMDVSTAVRIFLKQVVIERALPFRPSLDPFYNPANIAHLQQALQDVRAGHGIEQHALLGDDK